MAEAFTGLTGFRRVVDDISIYDSDEHQHAIHVWQFLQRCADKQIALNLEKCKFNQTEVTFAGFTLSLQWYRVDHSITDAILQFPIPTNQTDLWSLFGLVNQISSTTNAVTPLLTPLAHSLALKMTFIGYLNINKLLMLLRMPLQSHQYSLTLTPVSLPAYQQMLVAMALGSLYNKTLQAHGTSSRLDHDSLRTLNPDM